MSPKYVPPQSSFFYTGVFHADMDHTLLQSLVTQQNQDGWPTSEIPDDAVQIARIQVNHFHNTRLSLEEVYTRITSLQERYRTFKEVARYKGTKWDLCNNLVTADDRIWKKIYKVYPLGRAYRYAGDPEFHNLITLFGSDELKVESDHSVINISSTNREPANNDVTVLLGDDDEVSSPQLKSTRRELFPNDVVAADEESATNIDPRYVSIPPEGDPRLPPRNAFPSRPRGRPNNRLFNGSPSSCASCSDRKNVFGPF